MDNRPTRLLRTTNSTRDATLAARWMAIPPVGTADFGDWAADLAYDVAEHGIGHVETQIIDLVWVARRYQVAPVCGDIVGDCHQPEAARNRALAAVVGALCERTAVSRPIAA